MLPALPLPCCLPPAQQQPAIPHLILPCASMQDDACESLLAHLSTPHLDALLTWLRPGPPDLAQPHHPTPPHERALARAWGLDAEAPAWAAAATDTGSTKDSAAAEQPSAWLTPCHFHAGANQVRLDDPSALGLDLPQAQALCAILRPWWAEDGLTLEVVTPLLWRVSGAPLAQVRSASLDRALLRDASPWLPKTQPFQRLHSEAQMLLYQHPFNDAREAQGQPPVNGFWLHGVGQLTPAQRQSLRQQQAQQAITVLDSLRQSALRQQWDDWQQAWREAEAASGPLAQLLAHVQAGGAARLTLCGEACAYPFSTPSRPWLLRRLSRRRFADYHHRL